MNNLITTGIIRLIAFTPSFLKDSLTNPGPADFGLDAVELSASEGLDKPMLASSHNWEHP